MAVIEVVDVVESVEELEVLVSRGWATAQAKKLDSSLPCRLRRFSRRGWDLSRGVP